MKEVIVTMKLIDGHFYKTLRVTSQEDLEKQVKDWEDSFDVLVVSEHAHFDEIKLTIKESEEKMAQITAKIVDGVDGLFKGFADNIKVKLG